ncbi:morphogenetic protein [Klebsiella pneumoniae]|uniref:morphogenetic protein n=1 Tax=Klebsiella pneumoniae TaxID=573 RepID=UPI00140F8731|nr:morphogenetic protein [Klebsiella pneumoniae]NHR69107.1 morphogenetic protein [Klebsiella pneumoniae]NHR74832.1 morphogenetic protein [Klebsiella pneumoniae]NHR96994.1 morphogenetic protein [Klebsiella pneumoniae]NHS02777.1 morphogenetic protein [Klebsiella pneumoniae]QLB95549.1 morphogenetic protein [Klebsiella pneumoniae]
MKERGMIFNSEMVRAILDGRKTQTRRPVKFPVLDKNLGCELAGNELAGELSAGNYLNSAFGKPGDRIWVRETWARYNIDQNSHDIAYRATTPADWPEEGRWRPSIHMPRWASRILLEITDVRVERLNAISQENAQAEGMELTGWRPTYSDPDSGGEVMTPYDNFAELWSSIYGDESWKANPWVWVIEFKRVEGGAA